ncbi:cupredoxin domain-containing protein [Sphingomonas crusticola]|uniref:cupredoxin domain-containing protein n=1 Tax=Sphingomonas crusticola TaxID=1697973 RepID=UPI000E23FA6B|nr:cupredoxin domain-containing protein [Sphingomonas crusticola]
MKCLIPLTLLALATPTITSAQDWGRSKRIEIDLANFKYTPNRILLRHGEPYVLHFVNRASGGHDFAAKTFFAAARISPADSRKVAAGRVQLAGGESADVRVVAPAAGAIYEVHCSHFMHETFGMKGEIVVQ